MKKYIMSVLVVMIVFCSSVFAEETNSYSAKLRVDNIIEMKWKLPPRIRSQESTYT